MKGKNFDFKGRDLLTLHDYTPEEIAALEPDRYGALPREFLQRYEAAMCVHTRLFDGVAPLLDWLDAQHLPWGVVSNKVERYVRPILAELGLASRSVVAIGGDTTAHPKPHPAPLLHAARLTGLDPRHCLYVGDDHRDVLAGQAAAHDANVSS